MGARKSVIVVIVVVVVARNAAGNQMKTCTKFLGFVFYLMNFSADTYEKKSKELMTCYLLYAEHEYT